MNEKIDLIFEHKKALDNLNKRIKDLEELNLKSENNSKEAMKQKQQLNASVTTCSVEIQTNDEQASGAPTQNSVFIRIEKDTENNSTQTEFEKEVSSTQTYLTTFTVNETQTKISLDASVSTNYKLVEIKSAQTQTHDTDIEKTNVLGNRAVQENVLDTGKRFSEKYSQTELWENTPVQDSSNLLSSKPTKILSASSIETQTEQGIFVALNKKELNESQKYTQTELWENTSVQASFKHFRSFQTQTDQGFVLPGPRIYLGENGEQKKQLDFVHTKSIDTQTEPEISQSEEVIVIKKANFKAAKNTDDKQQFEYGFPNRESLLNKQVLDEKFWPTNEDNLFKSYLNREVLSDTKMKVIKTRTFLNSKLLF